MSKMTRQGKIALIVAAVVFVIAVSNIIRKPRPKNSLKANKQIQWEILEAETGIDLLRLETPHGWIVEGADGYLVFVPDQEKKWLGDKPDSQQEF